jgi:hypothetical protein
MFLRSEDNLLELNSIRPFEACMFIELVAKKKSGG